MPYHHGLLSLPDCASCPLQYYPKVFPDGLVPAPLALVGEGPGRNEEREGKGFVGATGSILWHLCEKAGFTREQVWCSNASLCRPRDVRLTTGAMIPEDKVKTWSASCCRKRLIEEMLIVQPKVIVPIGALALWALADFPNPSIYSYRGSRIDTDLTNLLDQIKAGTVRSVRKGSHQ